MGTSIQSFGGVASSCIQKLAATSIKGVASNPAYLNRESIVSTEPAAYLSDNHPIPERYVKAIHARNAKPVQGRQFVQGVKDIKQMGRDLVLRQKAGKAALQAKQNDRRARHQNIGRPAGQVKSSSNSPSSKGYVKNTRNNNVNRPQTTGIGGGGPSKGPSKSPANNTQNFLSGIRGKPKTFQQLQYQLRAACSPKDIKQVLADRQSSKLSLQDHGRYQSTLRRSMTNMASNPDTAHKLDSSFIKQVLRGDKAAINHTIASWGKADIAHMEERSFLLKNGQSYTAPSIKPQLDCSYGELHRQLTS
ncbi:hypothetical protein, partial [Endozoicomonas sp.]|uniref:hypothetical protein n=1 Tax=Endozoicomonas sp. TaxID=1892382 RepID=UPI00383B4D16